MPLAAWKPAVHAITATNASDDSAAMAPYPTNAASFSLASCFEVVPEATIEWKPVRAPQAMEMNRKGQIGGAFPA